MIFKKKKDIKPENDYPGIRNIRLRRKADCINYFYHEQKEPFTRVQQERRSLQRSENLQQWFTNKMDKLVDNSLEFFDDTEKTYADERKSG